MDNEQFLISALGVGMAVATAGMLYFLVALINERRAHQKTTQQRDDLLVQAQRALDGWKGCIAEQATDLLATVRAKTSEDSTR